MALTTDAAGATERGRYRRDNEDAFLVSVDANLYAVVDGVGGRPDGHDAAELVIATLREQCRGEADIGVLDAALRAAHERLQATSRARGHDRNMAAVGTVAWLRPRADRVVVGHIGDSRLFILDAQGVGEQVTEDEIEDSHWDSGPRAVGGNGVRRALGVEDQPGVTLDDMVEELALPPDRVLVLVTDGVSEQLSRAQICAVVAATRTSAECVGAVMAAVEQGEAANGRGDNASVVVVRQSRSGAGLRRVAMAFGLVLGIGGLLWAAYRSSP